MNDTAPASTIATPAPTPRHLWVVGFLAVMWNGFGAYDYVMTSVRNAGYLAQFPPEVVAVIDEMPVWAVGAWAIGVWGAVAGSLLLLLRSRLAVPAFGLSLAGLFTNTAYQRSIELPPAMTSPAASAMTVVIWVSTIAFLYYAVRMRRAGVLD